MLPRASFPGLVNPLSAIAPKKGTTFSFACASGKSAKSFPFFAESPKVESQVALSSTTFLSGLKPKRGAPFRIASATKPGARWP